MLSFESFLPAFQLSAQDLLHLWPLLASLPLREGQWFDDGRQCGGYGGSGVVVRRLCEDGVVKKVGGLEDARRRCVCVWRKKVRAGGVGPIYASRVLFFAVFWVQHVVRRLMGRLVGQLLTSEAATRHAYLLKRSQLLL